MVIHAFLDEKSVYACYKNETNVVLAVGYVNGHAGAVRVVSSGPGAILLGGGCAAVPAADGGFDVEVLARQRTSPAVSSPRKRGARARSSLTLLA